MTIDKDHPNEIVKRQYETLMENGMPFLQIFPEMIQELTVAETFKNRAKERNKSRNPIYNCFINLILYDMI